MTASASAAHLPALGSHERNETGTELQATLLEVIDLSLIGKQLHWSVSGPLFRSLHLYLDELIDTWRDLADSLAERAVTIGYRPDGQAATVAAGSGLSPVPVGSVPDHAVIRELVKLVAEVAERARGRMDRLGEIDAASQDVIVETVRALEAQLWMLRSQIA